MQGKLWVPREHRQRPETRGRREGRCTWQNKKGKVDSKERKAGFGRR